MQEAGRKNPVELWAYLQQTDQTGSPGHTCLHWHFSTGWHYYYIYSILTHMFRFGLIVVWYHNALYLLMESNFYFVFGQKKQKKQTASVIIQLCTHKPGRPSELDVTGLQCVWHSHCSLYTSEPPWNQHLIILEKPWITLLSWLLLLYG